MKGWWWLIMNRHGFHHWTKNHIDSFDLFGISFLNLRLRPKATGLFIAYMDPDPDDQTLCRFSESSFFSPSSFFVVEGWALFIDIDIYICFFVEYESKGVTLNHRGLLEDRGLLWSTGIYLKDKQQETWSLLWFLSTSIFQKLLRNLHRIIIS